MALIFDIETGPLAEDQLSAFLPEFVPPPHPGEFNPASVKLGNIKDEAKRAEKIEAARLAHEAAVLDYDSTTAAAKAAHLADFTAGAALSAHTGRILAIGYRSESGQIGIDDGRDVGEIAILATFWKKFLKCRSEQRRMVGCNIFGFDLPFIVRRSWILGVDVPQAARNGRYFDATFIDLREVWLLGQRWGDCPSSLDVMARALGVGGKPEGVSGGDFARLWFGTAEEKAKAVEYLRNDLAMTSAVATRLGVV